LGTGYRRNGSRLTPGRIAPISASLNARKGNATLDFVDKVAERLEVPLIEFFREPEPGAKKPKSMLGGRPRSGKMGTRTTFRLFEKSACPYFSLHRYAFRDGAASGRRGGLAIWAFSDRKMFSVGLHTISCQYRRRTHGEFIVTPQVLALGIFAIAIAILGFSSFVDAQRNRPSTPAFFGDESSPSVEHSPTRRRRNLSFNIIIFVMMIVAAIAVASLA